MTTDTAARPEPKRAEWQALTHLSIGRRGDKDKAADLVATGETVWLTEEESARLLDPSQYKVPVIRPATERSQPLPRVSAASLFGAKGRPAAPAPFPGSAALDVTNESRLLHDPTDLANHPEAEVVDVTDPDADRIGAPIRQQPRRPR